MMQLKACPKCHGDLMLTTYMDEYSASCLQSGFARSVPVPSAPRPLRVPLTSHAA